MGTFIKTSQEKHKHVEKPPDISTHLSINNLPIKNKKCINMRLENAYKYPIRKQFSWDATHFS